MRRVSGEGPSQRATRGQWAARAHLRLGELLRQAVEGGEGLGQAVHLGPQARREPGRGVGRRLARRHAAREQEAELGQVHRVVDVRLRCDDKSARCIARLATSASLLDSAIDGGERMAADAAGSTAVTLP